MPLFKTNKRRRPDNCKGITPVRDLRRKRVIMEKKAKAKLTPAFKELAVAAFKHGLTMEKPGIVMAREGIKREDAVQMFVEFILHNKTLNGVIITDSVRELAERTAETRIRNQYDPEIEAMKQ